MAKKTAEEKAAAAEAKAAEKQAEKDAKAKEKADAEAPAKVVGVPKQAETSPVTWLKHKESGNVCQATPLLLDNPEFEAITKAEAKVIQEARDVEHKQAVEDLKTK